MKRFELIIYGENDEILTFCQLAKEKDNARMVAQFVGKDIMGFEMPLTSTKEL